MTAHELKIERDRLYKMDDVTVLTALVYGEAQQQPRLGQVAVARTVVVRSKTSGKWKPSIRGCALQHRQYSCFNLTDPMLERIIIALKREQSDKNGSKIWERCRDAAEEAIRDKPDTLKLLGEPTHYFNPSIVVPYWSRSPKMTELYTIDDHKFYQEAT